MPDVHDYSAVDEAIRCERQAYREHVRFKRASALEVYGKFLAWFAGSIALLAIGLAIALSILGIDLRPSSQLFTTQAQPTRTNTLATAPVDTVSQLQRAVSERTPSSTSVTDTKITTSFTVFKEVDLGNDASVVTGWIFQPSDLNTPESQYCYWTQGSADFVSRRVDIGHINQAGETLWLPVRNDIAMHGDKCQWF